MDRSQPRDVAQVSERNATTRRSSRRSKSSPIASIMKVQGKKYELEVDPLKQQSIQEADGSRISALCVDGVLHTAPFGECHTLVECFLRGLRVSKSEERPARCLGWRPGPGKPYQWHTYEEVYQRANNFGAGLVAKGLHSTTNPFLGIYAQNSPQWVIAAEGAWLNSLAIVPLYDTLGPETCAFIINQAEICTVLCDTVKRAEHVIAIGAAAQVEGKTACVRRVVLLDDITDEIAQKAKAANVELCSFEEILSMGALQPSKETHPKSTDLAVVCYTSGTTGNPKGALITHGNYCATVAGVISHVGQGVWQESLTFGPEDVHLSYLPLAHTFEQVVVNTMFSHGSSIGFSQGNIKLLTDDLQALKPTIFPTVPRLLNRIYDGAMAKAKESKVKENLLKFALKRKEMEMEKGIFRNNSVWDKLVFKKMHQALGGRVRAIFCGSAPLSGRVMQFARCTLGAMIFEGFGQTENAAICTTQIPGDLATGVVGPPLPNCRIRLVDVPEMDCWAKDGRGEVCVKGPNVFQGYLKDPTNTAEALDADGWLHTGDIGTWQTNGALKIVDRKKHIFKLSQGEYIAPEKIENIYSGSKFVSQIFVHGESLKSNLVGVVVPDLDVVTSWAQTHIRAASERLSDADYEAVLRDPRLKSAILADMNQVAKKGGLKSFELVKDLVLDSTLWTVENEFLTPTFKTKRPTLKKRFAADIAKLYEKLE